MDRQDKRLHRLRRPVRFSTVRIWVAVAAAVCWPATVQAHEKWFHHGPQPALDFAAPFRPLPLFLIGCSIGVTALAAVPWWWRGRRDLLPGLERLGATADRLQAFYGLVPAILGVHLAIPLLANGVQGDLFSPDNELVRPWKYSLGFVQTCVSLAWFYGFMTRPAAVLLLLLWLAAIPLIGLEPALENIHFAGFAAFFWLAGRGPWSLDRLLCPRLEPSPQLQRWALPVARTGMGLSLIIVAFTEKFANHRLAISFLREYPLNFMPALGVNWSDETFALFAGAMELTIGLWVLLGLFPRLVVIVAWIPFTLTVSIFNWTELVGHLPIYGLLFVMLVWDARPAEQSVVIRGYRGEATEEETASDPAAGAH